MSTQVSTTQEMTTGTEAPTLYLLAIRGTLSSATLEEARAIDVLCEEPRQIDRDHRVALSVNDDRRHVDGGQRGAHVNERVVPEDVPGDARARALALVARHVALGRQPASSPVILMWRLTLRGSESSHSSFHMASISVASCRIRCQLWNRCTCSQ